MNKKLDITGEKYGRLTALEIDTDRSGRQTYWKCKCECGNIKSICLGKLRNGHTKSCGCLSKESSGRKPLPNNQGKKSILYSNYRNNARTKKVLFNLTKKEFGELISNNCFYCGVEPKQVIREYYNHNYRGKHNPLLYNGIDRIIPIKGYTKDNCVAYCKYCNFAKNDLSTEEFLKHSLRIVKYNKLIQGDL